MPTKTKNAAAIQLAPAAFAETSAATASPPITAAVAIELIATWSDMPSRNRRELCSAMNTCSRIAGVPPEMLPLTPEHLRSAVVTKPSATWDMQPGSKSNVLSRLRAVLVRLGTIDPPVKTLSPEWAALRAVANLRAQMSLAAFMGFLTAKGIAPEHVSDANLADFEAWLTSRTINGDPRAMVTATRRAWNQMARSVDLWPKTKLSLQSLRGQLLLPFSACPASFVNDIETYKHKLNGNDTDHLFGITIDTEDETDAFDELAEERRNGEGESNGPVVLRPLTIETKLQHIKVAFNALHRAGVPLSEITSLSCLVTPLPHPQKIIEQLIHENGGATKPLIAHVMNLLRELAKHHAKCPPKHIAQLARWTKRVRVGYHEMTGRNRKKLAQVCTPQRLHALRNMPDALTAQADELGPTFRGAVAARRAAILSLLTRAPMRLGNLMTLRLDEHLMRPEPRTGRITAIVIDAEETKNRRSLTYPLSQTTSSILQRFITEFRPLLTGPTNPYLFGGKDAKPMTRAGLRDTVKAITSECLGVAINPHLFRHVAAAVFLEACPGGFEDVRRLLGHKSVQTTTRAYTRIENEATVTKFDQILDDLNETIGQAAAKKPRAKPNPTAKRSAPKRRPRK